MADGQAKAIRKLGIGKACVLGVSQGGMIAQCMAIRHPEIVENLTKAIFKQGLYKSGLAM